MNLERLKLAVQLFRRLPAKLVDLECVVESSFGHPMPTLALNEAPPKPDCGSSGCFVGWCTAVPEFQQAGLTWDAEHDKLLWQGKREWFDHAAAALFGLRERDSFNLFAMPGNSDYDQLFEEDYNNRSKELFEARLAKFCSLRKIPISIFDEPAVQL